MSSTNKTENGLNQWVETDIPAMEDFNEDNIITAMELRERAPLESPALTGVPTAPTAEVDTDTEQIATTAFVKSQPFAPLESPILTGIPTAPTAPVRTNTTQLATTAFVMANTTFESKISFIYTCTGENDDLAIQNIVNDFFENGTAMSMKLIITGTMGLQANPEIAHIDINKGRLSYRDCICFLDFSDCAIPQIYSKKVFLNIPETFANTKIVIFGLNIYSNFNCIYIAGKAWLNNCIIHLSASTVAGKGKLFACVHITGEAKINNCILEGSYITPEGYPNYVYGAYIEESGSGWFDNCDILGYGTVIVAVGVAGFNNCAIFTVAGNGLQISGSKPILINGGTITATCGPVGTTAGYGIFCASTFSGTLDSDNVTIIGATTGIRVETASTAAEIKLTSCRIKGTSTQDIQQTTAANTVKWDIMGNSFSRASIIVDGTTAISYKAASASIYFPQYANKFSRTIA